MIFENTMNERGTNLAMISGGGNTAVRIHLLTVVVARRLSALASGIFSECAA